MPNDDEIAVKLTATTDALSSGMAEGKSVVSSASDDIRKSLRAMEDAAKNSELQLAKIAHAMGDLKAPSAAIEGLRAELRNLGQSAHESEGALKKLVSMETFDFLKERATEAFELIEKGFDSTVVKAEEFGLSTAKFAAIMGTTEADAAGLSAALRGVGVSTESYEGMALRLQKTLEHGGGVNKDLADSLKGSNGEALHGQELMERLKTVLEGYSEEGQNAAVVQLGLGRRVSDLTSALRVNEESVEHQKKIYREMGVNIDGTGESSQKLEEALNDQHTRWEALGLEIGQRTMPIVTQFMEFMSGPGTSILVGIGNSVKFIIVTFDVLAAMVDTVVRSIVIVLDGLWDNIKAGGKMLWDVLHGNFSAALEDVRSGIRETVSDAKFGASEISRYWDETGEHAALLFGKKNDEPEANPFKLKTGGKAAPEPPGKKNRGEKRDNTPDEEIRGEEQVALAKVALEEQTNAHLLAMGQESVDKFIEQQQKAEDDKYEIKTAALFRELELHGRSKAEQQKTINDINLAYQQHINELTKIEQEGETKRADLAKAAVAEFLTADEDRLKNGMQTIEALATEDQISNEEKTARERQLTTTIRTEQIARLNDELATLKAGSKAYDEVLKQRKALEQKLTQDLSTISKQRQKDVEADVKNTIEPMTRGFNGAINSMVFAGKSFEQAMRDMAMSIAQGFLDMIMQIAERWAITQITSAIIADQASAAQARSQIASSAAAAGAAAYAAVVGIPVVGIGAAPGAAAVAYAQTLAFEATVPAAAGGMLVDHDQLVFTHKDEQILPANLSKGFQDIIASGRAGSGGDTVVHVHQQFNATPQRDIRQLMNEAPGAFAAAFKQMQRDGRL